MPLAKCVRCNRMFNKVQAPVCPACQPDEEADYEKVREIVNREPDLDAAAVAEEANVDIEVVRRMLTEGQLVTVTQIAGIVCGRCGAPAISASKKLCQSCLEKLNMEVAKAQANIKLGMKKNVEVGEYDLNVRRAIEQKRRI